MADISIDWAKLRELPLRLKVVGAVIVIDAVFLLAAYLALDSLMAERVARIDQLKGTLTQLRKQGADIRKQTDEYPALRQHYEAAMTGGLAVPLDRLALVQAAQDSAAHHHLNDLHYKLTADAGGPEVATNPHFHVETDRIVLDNGGLLDTDVLAFWKDIAGRVNGHYRVVEITLERSGEVDPGVLANIRRGNPVSLLKAHFDLQWTGLTAQTVQGGGS